uniref:Metalloendopeptidase n=1 Tax=Rhabdoblennius nitidus TaxID=879521 RepID=A0A455R6S6_9TELE|nr:hatching enzyme [Rhabdoblennius nitidus]
MTLSASLLLLLLLLSLTQAIPLQEDQEQEGGPEGDPESVDIGSRILNTNNGTDEFLVEGDLLRPLTRNALKCWSQSCLWPKGSDGLVTIPYTVNRQFNRREIQTIDTGLKSFHRVSCIRFVSRTNQRDYLKIESQNGCFSFLGRQGKGQTVSLDEQGCVHHGIVQHEVLHALGFRHEHNRSDRDSYVRINWNNITPQSAFNFNKDDTNNLGVSYDYTSIMHYGRTAFSRNGQETITPIKDPHTSVGQRNGLSRLDIVKLNKLYSCEQKC